MDKALFRSLKYNLTPMLKCASVFTSKLPHPLPSFFIWKLSTPYCISHIKWNSSVVISLFFHLNKSQQLQEATFSAKDWQVWKEGPCPLTPPTISRLSCNGIAASHKHPKLWLPLKDTQEVQKVYTRSPASYRWQKDIYLVVALARACIPSRWFQEQLCHGCKLQGDKHQE